MRMIVVPPITYETSSEGEKEKLLKIHFKPFDAVATAELILRVSDGESLNTICQSPNMPSHIELESWKKTCPEIKDLLKAAKKVRAVRMKEDLVDVSNELFKNIYDKSVINPKNISVLLKLVERISSIDDKDQDLSLRNKTEVNVQVNNKSAPTFIIEDPYGNKFKDVEIDKFRIDSDNPTEEEDESPS